MARYSLSLRLALMSCLAILAAMWVDCAHGMEPAVSFTRDVKPLLARRCFRCHGPTANEGGLRLDDANAVLKELDSGLRAIVPGDLEHSELISRVTAADEGERMPPEGKPLTPVEIDTLKRWITAGAKWEKHWAFVPPERREPPSVQQRDWIQNPIDAFVLARLEAASLSPAPPTDKRMLVRRAYFDLTGLPPTGEQIDTFLNDSDPGAWGHLVDTLLASPHYGEHWARHWLDLVRYAETNSFERDGLKPNAWKYRDYVIRSFNDDKPYDQFVREQLAGDELDRVTDDSMTATAYYRLGTWDDEPADPLQSRFDEYDDIISTTSQAMLALTVGCARCHDHKIDPIPQSDYYGFLAFFADVTPYADIRERDPARFSQWDMSNPEELRKRAELRSKEDTTRKEVTSMEDVGIRRMAASEQEIAGTPDRAQLVREKLEQHLNSSEWGLYQDAKKRLDAVREEIKKLPAPNATLALAKCEPHPAATRLLQRGNPQIPGDEVQPHFPALFGEDAPAIPPAAEGARSAGRRRVLADWIASPNNMLTARVIANRVWQHHFGRGLVRSANNFGELGTPPTHPELLDWLALWLIDHEWRLKPLHRLIMTSNAYRMSSAGNEKALAVDPANDLLWRFDMRRLSAEELRDAMLVVSGEFNARMYGPGIYPKLSQEVLATQSRPGDGWGKSTREEQARRSVYIHVKRSLLPPLLTAFDFPDVDASCEARFVTTQPGQALAMLHGEFAIAQAGRLAERAATLAGAETGNQVREVLRLALGRDATDDEVSDGMNLIQRLADNHGQSAGDAFKYWCLTVLNLNEFVYLD